MFLSKTNLLFFQLQASEFEMAVAQAPSVAVNRVATYKELDGDLMRQAAFSTLEDIGTSKFKFSIRSFSKQFHFFFQI